MKKIEHIGIAVKSIENANKIYTSLLGYSPYKTEEVKSEGVKTSFFKTGDSKIELLEATNPESPIAKFIEKKGEGIHHIAYQVEDLEGNLKILEEKQIELIDKKPKTGAEGNKIVFLHPKSTFGVLTELCE